MNKIKKLVASGIIILMLALTCGCQEEDTKAMASAVPAIEVRDVWIEKSMYKVGEEVNIYFELHNSGKTRRPRLQYTLTYPDLYTGTKEGSLAVIEHGTTVERRVCWPDGLQMTGKYLFEVEGYKIVFYVTSPSLFYYKDLESYSEFLRGAQHRCDQPK